MTRIAALTGGTGFLGRHLIRALHDAGWQVRMLTRSAPDLPELADIPIALIPGGIADSPALEALCTGADAILHLAGAVTAPDRATFIRTNVGGTAAIAAAWRKAAPGADFTLVSSMAARAPLLSDYAHSKHAAELALKNAADAGSRWRVLRPAAIYGAYDTESLKVLKLANGPFQVMLNAPAARVAMIDARDAAAAIVSQIGAGPSGMITELTDQRRDGYTWRELTVTASRVLGHTPRPLRLPAPALRALGAAGSILNRITGGAGMVTKGKAREILHPDWSADPDLPHPPGLPTPRIDLATGLMDMARWACSEGLLRAPFSSSNIPAGGMDQPHNHPDGSLP